MIVVALPLREPWRTAFGELRVRRTVLVRVEHGGVVGWGECPALEHPGYSAETTADAAASLRDDLVPHWCRTGTIPRPAGRPMAAAALESATTDLGLRRAGRNLAAELGATAASVPAGIAIGLAGDPAELRAAVDRAVEEGYRRVKVKVEPGRDVTFVGPLRAAHPDLPLWADGNGSYRIDDPAHRRALRALDELGVGLIEQPLPAGDLEGHAALAAELAAPVCLDEPLTSLARTVEAVERGACSVVNLKPARVGGLAEARRILAWCSGRGVDVWIGGLLESGVGRATNVALAAAPGVTMVGDLSPSSRFFATDLVDPPISMHAGWIRVPDGAGSGATVDEARVDDLCEARYRIL